MTNPADKPGDDDKNPIERAIESLSESFRRLTNPGVPTGSDVTMAFFRAVKSNRTKDLKKILDAGFDPNTPNSQGETALHIAARNNAAAAARLLIERGADPLLGERNRPNHKPLEDAVSFNAVEMAELLAEKGGYVAGTGLDGWSLLHRACEKGQVRVVEALLRAGAAANATTDNGSTPLLIAVKAGHAALVRLLLTFPDVLNDMNSHYIETDWRKCTALELAVEYGRRDMVAMMIEKGVNLNRIGEDGKTVLLTAIDNLDLPLIRLLIESGADLNTSYPPHGTPLAYACTIATPVSEILRTDIVGLLLELGADPDVAPAGGQTPLILSVIHNHRTCVRALLEAHADANIRDSIGKSAHDHAQEKNNAEILQMLKPALKENIKLPEKPKPPLP